VSDIVVAGRYGCAEAPAGVHAFAKSNVQLAEIVALRGKEGLVAQALERAFSIPPPAARRRVQLGRVVLWWSGPGRFLWEAHAGTDSDVPALEELLAGTAAVVRQTEGRLLLRVYGAKVRETLRKGFTIDLHPRAFTQGDTAITAVAGMDVQIAQVDASPAYDIVVYRSFAASFWTWLKASAEEFGLDAVNESAMSVSP
jgi:sarcosine oxidase subunit gamma